MIQKFYEKNNNTKKQGRFRVKMVRNTLLNKDLAVFLVKNPFFRGI